MVLTVENEFKDKKIEFSNSMGGIYMRIKRNKDPSYAADSLLTVETAKQVVEWMTKAINKSEDGKRCL